MGYKRGAQTVLSSCLLVFVSFTVPILGQTTRTDNKPPAGGDGTDQQLIRCIYSLVVVNIEVRDGYGWPVSDVTHNDIVVFEDGEEQPIQFFQRKEVPNAESAQGLYEVGYFPPHKDGEFKKIRLRFREAEVAKEKGWRLVYQPRGYYATFKH